MPDQINTNLKQMIHNINRYYSLSMKQRDLTPPVFFHERAISLCKKDFLSEAHIEAIYATLVAWSMHRPGKKGPKMPAYPEFKGSILSNEHCIRMLKNYKIETISNKELDEILPCLTCLCFNINASACSTKIVSASKTLAHILPDLVCPIDNFYTLTFFKDSVKNMTEPEKFQNVIKQMWMFFNEENVKKTKIVKRIFAHSYPKIFDNLIMAFIENNKP